MIKNLLAMQLAVASVLEEIYGLGFFSKTLINTSTNEKNRIGKSGVKSESI